MPTSISTDFTDDTCSTGPTTIMASRAPSRVVSNVKEHLPNTLYSLRNNSNLAPSFPSPTYTNSASKPTKMAVPLEPLKPFACNKAGCYNSFETEKELKYHKVNDPTHFYCKKCDVDCEDWAALVQHKVDSMAPFLEMRVNTLPDGAKLKHIVCEFCGEDFKSMGGRQLHRESRHKGSQEIKCPGCPAIFVRAAFLIGHIENDECETIRAYELIAHIQHKYVKKEIMKDLCGITENLKLNGPSETPGLIQDDDVSATEDDLQTEDGVYLHHECDESDCGGVPLGPRLDSIELGGKKCSLTRNNLETWPRLPHQTGSSIPDQIRNEQIGSPPPSIVPTAIPAEASDWAARAVSQTTSRRGGEKVYTESYPSLPGRHQVSHARHPMDGDSYDDEDDAISVSTAKPEHVLSRPAAWTTAQTSRALFGDVNPTENAKDAEAILARNREETEKAPNLILNSRWWDPYSDEYNPELFKKTAVGSYACPFPDCDAEVFGCSADIEAHLLHYHTRIQYRCPGCLKLFKRAQDMVAHIEDTRKCPIKKSDSFRSVLDEISGGFLKAKRLPQPEIFRPETAVVRANKKPLDGVLSLQYSAHMPK